MPCQFEVTRRVEFSETDMEGLMHFSNFFRFMETAEGAFLRSLGLSVVLSRNGLAVGLPRVHAECDYLAPLRFEDEVLVRLLVEKKGRRSLTYQFRFYRLNGPAPQLVARGRLTAVCAKRQADGSLKAAALPRVLADQLEAAPADLLADDSLPARGRVPARAEEAARLRLRLGSRSPDARAGRVPDGRGGEAVAQVSKPAVSPTSKSAARPPSPGPRRFGNLRHSRLGSLRYEKPVKYSGENP